MPAAGLAGHWQRWCRRRLNRSFDQSFDQSFDHPFVQSLDHLLDHLFDHQYGKLVHHAWPLGRQSQSNWGSGLPVRPDGSD